jgi:hypothetical protein
MTNLTLKTKTTLAVSLLVAGIALFIGAVTLFEFERNYQRIIADQQSLGTESERIPIPIPA